MTERERLTDLLESAMYRYAVVEDIADYLLEHGVIVPPCKVGDTVYQTDGIQIYSSTIKTVIYDTDSIAFDERAIGKNVFLARDKAEAALKERSKENANV